MDNTQLVEVLLGRRKSDASGRGSRIPPYLNAKYDREGAAGNLAEHARGDVRAGAALLRAALTDEEEDVRKRCLELLIDFDARVATFALAAAAYDSDATVRETALEFLNSLDPRTAKTVARGLLNDGDAGVVETARMVLSA